ncbi:hypothetical protein CO662_29190 [Rhizobium anhuiense]|uniref:Uncharacterized protein n=1 Tax=Rhizobium anhuiense TaxID=1184720 RepID=A0ABX4J072_9HYPH|nr:hypothetical protein CO662_29190 [Rhizobium anhuiense]
MRVETRPAFRAGQADAAATSPNKTERTNTLRYALMLRASAPDARPLLRCARRLIVRMSPIPVTSGDGSLDCSRRRLASASLTKPVWPPCYSFGADYRPGPVIAVALSEDSQQHGRVGHGGQTGLVRDGRIGYWYTNSRFARGAIV